MKERTNFFAKCCIGPFLVRCYHIFEDSEKLYFVMECASGGELFVHLSREKVLCLFCWFEWSQRSLRFLILSAFDFMLPKCFWDWSICTVWALFIEIWSPKTCCWQLRVTFSWQTLESPRKVWTTIRCAQPLFAERLNTSLQKCFLDKDTVNTLVQAGGLSLILFCIGKAVDWWSYGSVCYEMLTGLPPYYSEDITEMYKKILQVRRKCKGKKEERRKKKQERRKEEKKKRRKEKKFLV